MRNLFYTLSLALLLPSAPSLAQSNNGGFSMEECHEAVAPMNANLPMDLDDITTWTQTTCKDTGGDTVQLVYANVVKDGNAITQENLDAVKPSLIMSWCLGPTLAPLMQMVDTVHYEYHFANGERIGGLDFSFLDCIAQE